MKLLLRVMFNQGSLWRDRWPQAYDDPEPPLRRIAVAIPASVIFIGVLSILNGSSLVGVLTIALGAIWGIALAMRAAITSLPSHRVWWTNAHWVAVSVFALSIPPLIVVAIVLGAWVDAAFLLLVHVTYGSFTIRQIEARFLFFCDPVTNKALLDDPGSGRGGYLRGLIERQKDVYVRFPRAILRSSRTEAGSDAG